MISSFTHLRNIERKAKWDLELWNLFYSRTASLLHQVLAPKARQPRGHGFQR